METETGVAAGSFTGTGALLWAHVMPDRFDHPLGGVGPRSTPSIAGGRVYALDPYGRLVSTSVTFRGLSSAYARSGIFDLASIVFVNSPHPIVRTGVRVRDVKFPRLTITLDRRLRHDREGNRVNCVEPTAARCALQQVAHTLRFASPRAISMRTTSISG